jgi:hypothetical protein
MPCSAAAIRCENWHPNKSIMVCKSKWCCNPVCACLQRSKGAKLRNAAECMLNIVIAQAPQPALQMHSRFTQPRDQQSAWQAEEYFSWHQEWLTMQCHSPSKPCGLSRGQGPALAQTRSEGPRVGW